MGLGLRQQDADADLFLEDAEGTVLHSSTVDGTANEAINETLLAGTYYVRVEAQEEGANDFRLRYGVSAPDAAAVTALQQREHENTNEAPAFAESTYAFDLAENADGSTNGVALGTVSATDPEATALTYSIEGGNSAGLFEIDGSTGALSYKGTGEDYESGTTSYALTVRASDGSLHSDVTVTVNVTDVEEKVDEPLIAQQQQAAVQETVSEPDGIDFAADTSSQGQVAVGDTATGEIGTSGDRDWFAVTFQAGRTYRIDLEGWYPNGGPLWDPYLRGVYDADGNLIEGTTSDDGGVWADSRVYFVAETDGTHYIAAGSDRGHTGTYRLSVREVEGDDYSAGTDSTGTVAVDGSATGKIERSGDRDWFEVTLEAGKTYRFDLEGSSTNAGTLRDPYLRGVYDADGNQIGGTTNNNGGVYSNSRVYFESATDGAYYIAAGALGSGTGTYRLSVTELEDDYSADTDTTGTVEVDGSARGKIESPGDRDWFEVTLEAGTTYRIDLEGGTPDPWTMLTPYVRDPYLRGVYDADGNLIGGTTNNDRGGGLRRDSRVFFEPETAGTYYIAAGANGGGTGLYDLSVTDVGEDDYSADTDTAGTVAVDGSAAGEIETPNDRDWFEVTLEGGTRYRMDLEGFSTHSGTLWDPRLHGVYDEDGTLMAGTTNNDGGHGGSSRVHFEPETGGVYYVAAGTNDGSTGTYRLTVTRVREDAHSADTDTTGTVAVGGFATGEIENPNDRDWFEVTLVADKTYRIDIEGSRTNAGTLYDPHLHGVYDADGTLIAGTTNDHGGYGVNARIYFEPDTGGTYYIAAGAGMGTIGGYRISLTEIGEDDYSADTDTTGRVAVGGSVTGEIEPSYDRDWFEVTLEAGTRYRIDLEDCPRTPGHCATPPARRLRRRRQTDRRHNRRYLGPAPEQPRLLRTGDRRHLLHRRLGLEQQYRDLRTLDHGAIERRRALRRRRRVARPSSAPFSGRSHSTGRTACRSPRLGG